MWVDSLYLIVDFLLDTLKKIADLMTSTILILALGLTVLSWIVKFFRRFL